MFVATSGDFYSEDESTRLDSKLPRHINRFVIIWRLLQPLTLMYTPHINTGVARVLQICTYSIYYFYAQFIIRVNKNVVE